MIQHLLKLIWKQRRQNAWIVAELFLVFILVWYIMDYFTTIRYADSIENAYNIEDTYQIRLTTVPVNSPNYIRYENAEKQPVDQYLSIIERIRQYPQVEDVCLTLDSSPYNPSYMDNRMEGQFRNGPISIFAGYSLLLRCIQSPVFRRKRTLFLKKCIDRKGYCHFPQTGRNSFPQRTGQRPFHLHE